MPSRAHPEPHRPAQLSAGLMALLASTVFAAAGSMHYQSSMLTAIGADFGADAARAGWIATLSFAGYLAGMLLLVPQGDRLDKRSLTLAQTGTLVLASVAMGLAPTLAVAAAASFAIGLCVPLTQSMVPLVYELAAPERRGRAVGTLLSALFLGILFARVAGGLIAETIGWRWAYAFAVLLLAVLAPVLVLRLPAMPPRAPLSTPALYASLLDLVRAQPRLRRISMIQLFVGVCYGGFWAVIAPMLALLHGLGPAAAGLMAIPGAAGTFVSWPAGKWMDASGPRPVTLASLAVLLAAIAALAFAAWSVWMVVLGAILLDCAVRASIVANQTSVNALAPHARSRIATVYASHMWAGNAAGAFLASTALARGGWLAVCGLFTLVTLVALALQWRPPREG